MLINWREDINYFTLNRAERSIRPSFMDRETNGGSRFDTGDRAYEALASVSYSSKLRNSNIMADMPGEIWK
ncbi:hypothetical protein Thermo_02064 [Thermoplasmatales archaeon]|nr:hypothetical protein Thermo_02064 [Thermoplasmatales archaeon]